MNNTDDGKQGKKISILKTAGIFVGLTAAHLIILFIVFSIIGLNNFWAILIAAPILAVVGTVKWKDTLFGEKELADTQTGARTDDDKR